ncbi:MAG: hypothetical protein H6707_02500 [Deltaproteobacteria bacterium]|nr:hypothetical protein [Deltaproteobacteria bacterium]
MARQSQRDPLLSRTLHGRYRLEEILERDSLGVAFRARHLRLKSWLAVKAFHRGLLSRLAPGELESELRTVSSLRSPHLARIIDLGDVDNGRTFVVRPLAIGQPLSELIARSEPPPEALLRLLLLQLCQGLAEAHQAGLVHGHLAPNKISIRQTSCGVHATLLGLGELKLAQAAAVTLPYGVIADACPQTADVYAIANIAHRWATGLAPQRDRRQPEYPRPMARLARQFSPQFCEAIDAGLRRETQSIEDFVALMGGWPHSRDSRATLPMRAQRPAWQVQVVAPGFSPAVVPALMAMSTEQRPLSRIPTEPMQTLAIAPTTRPVAARQTVLSQRQTQPDVDVSADGELDQLFEGGELAHVLGDR